MFASLGIIGPALVTLISSCSTLIDSCFVPIISITSSIGTAILVLTRWQDGWLRYRKTVERIKSLISIYLVEINDETLSVIKKSDINQKFINKIEEIVIEENCEWVSIRKKDLESDD